VSDAITEGILAGTATGVVVLDVVFVGIALKTFLKTWGNVLQV
jgi:hypothetical protein